MCHYQAACSSQTDHHHHQFALASQCPPFKEMDFCTLLVFDRRLHPLTHQKPELCSDCLLSQKTENSAEELRYSSQDFEDITSAWINMEHEVESSSSEGTSDDMEYPELESSGSEGKRDDMEGCQPENISVDESDEDSCAELVDELLEAEEPDQMPTGTIQTRQIIEQVITETLTLHRIPQQAMVDFNQVLGHDVKKEMFLEVMRRVELCWASGGLGHEADEAIKESIQELAGSLGLLSVEEEGHA